MVEDLTHFGRRTLRNQAGTDPKASLRSVFLVSEAAVQAAKGEKQPIVLPNYKAHELQH